MQPNKEILVYTYGAFDLLHVGHIVHLEKARALGTKLMVGILSDKAISDRKGKDRPIQSIEDRMRIVGSLKCVDYVCHQEGYDLEPNMIRYHPDIVTKGDDWEMCKKQLEPFHFIKFVPLDYSQEYSTSGIVETIKNATTVK
jgi:rfaE bifunctional protein nucleotidyltransferase chain/domain